MILDGEEEDSGPSADTLNALLETLDQNDYCKESTEQVFKMAVGFIHTMDTNGDLVINVDEISQIT